MWSDKAASEGLVAMADPIDLDQGTPRSNEPADATAEDRRVRILSAACRLFHHYGAKKTTVADIAQEADVGTGSVYLEFRSKTAIVEALSAQSLRSVLEAMEEALSGDAPVETRLAHAFDARFAAFLTIARQGHHAMELMHCSSSPVQTAWEAFEREQLALFVGVLEHAGVSFLQRCNMTTAESAAPALIAAYAQFAPPVLNPSRPPEASLLQALHQIVLGVG